MGVNKVIYGGNTLVDLSETTVTPETMLKGVTAINAAGEAITGVLEPLVDEKVNFYDYDGTLLHSYTVREAQALTELPTGVEHEGLTFSGWNWTLNDIKALNRAVNVGALYTTDTNATRIHIHLESGRTSPVLGLGVNGNVIVDWGDNTVSTLEGTSIDTVQWTETHEYANPGDYVITLTASNRIGFLGTSEANTGGYILRHSSGADTRNMAYLNAVRKVEIGDRVSKIGNSAFNGCYSLETVSVASTAVGIGDYAYYGCYSLKAVTIPTGTASIGARAFYNCYKLVSASIPKTVTTVEDYAFYNCHSMDAIAFPDGLSNLGAFALYSCGNLTSVIVPEGITSIGEKTFCYCTALITVDLPDTLTSIATNAFYDCSVASIKIPNSVTSIGTNAFYNCNAMSEITIPSGLATIEDGMLYSCASIKSVEIPDGITAIGGNAFYGCSALTDIVVPESVQSIGSNAFYKCNSLSEFTVPDGVTELSPYAFFNCYSLDSISIPESVTTFGASLFSGSRSLASIKIPGNATKIDANAFYGCSSLATIDFSDIKQRNLLRNSASTTTKSGMTFTVNADGSVTCNGTATADVYFVIGSPALKTGTDYILTGCPEGGTGSGSDGGFGYRIYVMDTTSWGIKGADYGSGFSFNSGEYNGYTIRIQFKTGYTANNLVFYPMLRYAANASDVYEPFSAPRKLETIGASAFYDCSTLSEVAFPATVSSIGSKAFYNCYGVRNYDFSACTAVPTLGTNAFVGIAADCQIKVPESLHSEWCAATNWSAYASYIVAV